MKTKEYDKLEKELLRLRGELQLASTWTETIINQRDEVNEAFDVLFESANPDVIKRLLSELWKFRQDKKKAELMTKIKEMEDKEKIAMEKS